MADDVTLLDANKAEFSAAADFIGSAYYQRVKISWGTDGSAVDASDTNPFPTKLTNIEKAEDAAHSGGDKGIMALGVRRDAPVDGTSNNTDYLPLALDKYGEARVISGASVIISDIKTRPSNGTAYAAGQVINESVSAGTVFTFTGCARVSGGSGIISKVVIDDSSNASTKLQCDLVLFNTAYTADNDGAVFTPTDAEARTIVARIPLTNQTVNDATANGGGNCTLWSGVVNEPFVCAADANLYGVLVATDAYTPISGEVFNVRLFIYQD